MKITLTAIELHQSIKNHIKNTHGIEIDDSSTETFIMRPDDPEPKAFWAGEGIDSEIYVDVMMYEDDWSKLQ